MKKIVRSAYIAYSNLVPVEGIAYKCTRLVKAECGWKRQNVVTTIVKEVEQMGDNMYKVITENSMYVVKVA